MGMGIKSISSAFHLSRNTVRKYVRRYQESSLTLEQLTAMSEEKLQEMFLDDCNRSHKPTPLSSYFIVLSSPISFTLHTSYIRSPYPASYSEIPVFAPTPHNQHG